MQLCVWRTLTLASALVTSLSAAAAAASIPQLPALKRAVADAEARSVRTGVAISDAKGRVLYRHRVGDAFTPASNMKLLTAAGVLHGLGPEFQFRTVFKIEKGELLVEASGDPNWLRGTEHDPELVFGKVAHELKKRGLVNIRGVRLVHGTFVGPTRPEMWPKDQLYTYYCAPTGGFVLEQGTFVMSVQRSGSRRAKVGLVAPASGYGIRGSITEVSARKGAVYGAIDQGDAIKVRGKFYKKSPRVEIKTAMVDPAKWYRDTLIHQLAKAGVNIHPNAKTSSVGVIYTHATGLGPALKRMLEDSSNFAAEQCMRVLGAQTRSDGSLAGGAGALHKQLTSLVGYVPEGARIVDGSGLSKENKVTPGLMLVTMLKSFGGAHGTVLKDSLAIAGETGTLRKRFAGTNLIGRVRAKTGWIRGASSLSGYVEMPDKSVRWFSILMNYGRGRNGLNKDLKLIQERIVKAVAGIGAN